LSSAAANGQPRAQRSDELVVKLDCQPALAGQPVAYRIEFRQTSDCTNAATITMTGTRQDRFDSLGAAPVSACNLVAVPAWPSCLNRLATEPSLPLLTVKMMPNCSGLTVKPVEINSRALTVLEMLKSGDAADMCILIQEHGYSNRRSLFGELRADNRTCSAAASASVGNGGQLHQSGLGSVRVRVLCPAGGHQRVLDCVLLCAAVSLQAGTLEEGSRKGCCNAAKTALSKIPVRILQLGDDAELQWIGDHCAVCIEPYGCGDPVRIFAVQYHTHCIDQWLLDQRSCPLCKTDILKACGLWVSGGSRISLDDVTITPGRLPAASAHWHRLHRRSLPTPPLPPPIAIIKIIIVIIITNVTREAACCIIIRLIARM
uniref:RING-type domain-containing protein n=1 Tax=Macrostomum lignano TaxID=282301 RepID=A0A1I8F983_9PLAT